MSLFKQRNVPWLGAFTESLFTTMPVLSILNFVSIMMVLYTSVRQYLPAWLTFWWFVGGLTIVTLLLMLAMYLWVLPSIWTFRAKQMNSFENEMLTEVKKLSPPKVVCLCGSSRFVAEMAIVAWNFEKEGWIALGLHLMPLGYKTEVADHLAEAEGVAEKMDALHLRKIDISSLVFIYNKGGYIGQSTRREIEYSKLKGKQIQYLEEDAE